MMWPFGKKEQVANAAMPVEVGNKQEYLDVDSPTWRFVVAYAMREQDRLRRLNDSLGNDADQTAALRGEIKAMGRLIKLPERLIQEPVQAASHYPPAMPEE